MGVNYGARFVPKDRRRLLKVFTLPKMLLVGNSQVHSGLGINRDRALESRLEFSRQLYTLAQAMLDGLGENDLPDKPPNNPQQVLDTMKEVLTLSEEESLQVLDGLREVGAPLYADLSIDLIQTFRRLGFLGNALVDNILN